MVWPKSDTEAAFIDRNPEIVDRALNIFLFYLGTSREILPNKSLFFFSTKQSKIKNITFILGHVTLVTDNWVLILIMICFIIYNYEKSSIQLTL
jgi:hypothetical protein